MTPFPVCWPQKSNFCEEKITSTQIPVIFHQQTGFAGKLIVQNNIKYDSPLFLYWHTSATMRSPYAICQVYSDLA